MLAFEKHAYCILISHSSYLAVLCSLITLQIDYDVPVFVRLHTRERCQHYKTTRLINYRYLSLQCYQVLLSSTVVQET
jgi:hypothetical protein